jgi:predicted RecA/RadA family phage recombinase
VAEQYVAEFGKLAKTNNTVILPATLSDVGSMIALATNVLRTGKDGEPVRNTVFPPGRGAHPPVAPPPRPPGRPLPEP